MEYSGRLAGGVGTTGRVVREGIALVCVGAVYWLWLQPLARREIAFWERRARAIPDRSLRECALAKLSDEALNPEAAALFAVLSPAAERRRVAEFIVAYQVLYDYLDAVNEMPEYTELRAGLQLHLALTDALKPGSADLRDVYPRHCFDRDDGGYVEALVRACRDALGALPPGASEVVIAAATRCGTAQSHNHAFLARADSSLIRWSLKQRSVGATYEWWELAAAGISCLAVHALVACAAQPGSSEPELLSVDRAYFPSVCGLSALLDSLADFYQDAGSENHSFAAHYRDGAHAARRLVAIGSEASTLLGVLPNAARHKVILVGICSYYLSCSSVLTGFPVLARQALLENLGWLGTPMLTAMRARRRVRSRRSQRPAQPPASCPAR
jgi:tetraprenyl-beta-curcumene synthase